MTLERRQPLAAGDLIEQTRLDSNAARTLLEELIEQQKVRDIGGLIITENGWQALLTKAQNALKQYHQQNPLRLGMPRQELRSRLDLTPPLFNALIAESVAGGMVSEEKTVLRTSDHALTFSREQEEKVDRFLKEMKRSGASTPSVKESQQKLGDDIYYALIDLGRLQQLNSEVVYEQEQYRELSAQVVDFLQKNGQIDAAQTRDLLKTSRKYAIAILEHLDDIKADQACRGCTSSQPINLFTPAFNPHPRGFWPVSREQFDKFPIQIKLILYISPPNGVYYVS